MRPLTIILATLSVGMGSDVVGLARERAFSLMKEEASNDSAPHMWVLKQMNVYLVVMSAIMNESSDDRLANTVEALGRFGAEILSAGLSDSILRRIGAIFEQRRTPLELHYFDLERELLALGSQLWMATGRNMLHTAGLLDSPERQAVLCRMVGIRITKEVLLATPNRSLNELQSFVDAYVAIQEVKDSLTQRTGEDVAIAFPAWYALEEAFMEFSPEETVRIRRYNELTMLAAAESKEVVEWTPILSNLWWMGTHLDTMSDDADDLRELIGYCVHEKSRTVTCDRLDAFKSALSQYLKRNPLPYRVDLSLSNLISDIESPLPSPDTFAETLKHMLGTSREPVSRAVKRRFTTEPAAVIAIRGQLHKIEQLHSSAGGIAQGLSRAFRRAVEASLGRIEGYQLRWLADFIQDELRASHSRQWLLHPTLETTFPVACDLARMCEIKLFEYLTPEITGLTSEDLMSYRTVVSSNVIVSPLECGQPLHNSLARMANASTEVRQEIAEKWLLTVTGLLEWHKQVEPELALNGFWISEPILNHFETWSDSINRNRFALFAKRTIRRVKRRTPPMELQDIIASFTSPDERVRTVSKRLFNCYKTSLRTALQKHGLQLQFEVTVMLRFIPFAQTAYAFGLEDADFQSLMEVPELVCRSIELLATCPERSPLADSVSNGFSGLTRLLRGLQTFHRQRANVAFLLQLTIWPLQNLINFLSVPPDLSHD